MERYPNLKKEVGGSIHECEISSLLARWSTASCALALTCRPSVSKQKNKYKMFEVQWSRALSLMCEVSLEALLLTVLAPVSLVSSFEFDDDDDEAAAIAKASSCSGAKNTVKIMT